MATIDAEQRTRECDALMDAVVAARQDNETRVEALQACIAHPCAYHELDLPELYGTLGQDLARLERYDESLEAWEGALAAGARGLPHPRADVAEVLLRAGRRKEADTTFADLRRQCPDDIWLYNAAGYAYAWAGEHGAALPWLEQGILMALADGDRDGILHQLDEERTRCREALGTYGRRAQRPCSCIRAGRSATRGRVPTARRPRCTGKHIRSFTVRPLWLGPERRSPRRDAPR